MIDLDTDSWQWHDNLHSWRRPFTMSVPFRIKVDLMHTQNKAPNWWKHSVGKISQKSHFSWNDSSRKSRFWIIKKSPLNPLNKDPKVWNVPVRTYTKMAAIHHGFLFGWLFSMLFLWLRRLRRRPLWRRDFSVSIKVLALALQWETGGRGDIGSSCHLPAGRHFSYDHAEPLSPFIFTISMELKASEASFNNFKPNNSTFHKNSQKWVDSVCVILSLKMRLF